MYKIIVSTLIFIAYSTPTFAESQCSILFSNPLLTEEEYRVNKGTYLRKKVNIGAISAGEFSGTDRDSWTYQGTFDGDSFNYTMTSGSFIIKGKGACTSFGAIGTKKYTKGSKEKYLFTWRTPDNY